jgi:hypothetical protein
MSGPLSSPRPIFEIKIGVASWVSWSGPSAPANPTGNPNFNLKNRPEVNKSGPGNEKKLDGSVNGLFDEKNSSTN